MIFFCEELLTIEAFQSLKSQFIKNMRKAEAMLCGLLDSSWNDIEYYKSREM